VISSGQEITLNPDFVSVDLWEFESALVAGNPERAVDLYGGPFLNGFGLADLSDFDEWMESERARIGRRFKTALEESATLDARRGDHVRSVELLRTRSALDPLSAPPAVAVMQALVAAGDRASAIAYGHEYATLIQRELACDPDASIAALISALRVRTPTSNSPFITPVTREPPEVPHEEIVPTRDGDGNTASAIASARIDTWPARVRVVRIGTALVAAAVVVALAISRAERPAASVQSPEIIAVFPFTVAGGSESQYLGNGLVELLSTSLDGAGTIRGVDPRALLSWLESQRIRAPGPSEAGSIAARFGAGRYVLGSVTRGGSRIRLLASVYQRGRPDSAIGSAITEGDAGDLFRLVDDLTSQLLVAIVPGPRHRLVKSAATTTHSLAALKQYLTGEEDLRARRYLEAAAAFENAVRLDSTFALAYFRLGIAADWLGRDSMARSANAAALARADRLSERDALVVRATDAARRGDADAERLFRRFLVDYPDDLEAWLELGEIIFHRNPLRGRSATESRFAFERVLRLDSDNDEALLHLARIAALEGKQSEGASFVTRLLRTSSGSEVLALRAFRAFALGDQDNWKQATRELVDHPPDIPPVTAVEMALLFDDVDGAEKFAGILTEPLYSDQVRGLGHRLLARGAAARGQWDKASMQLDTAQTFDETAALELRSLMAAFDFLDVPVAEVREIRAGLERWDASAADLVNHQHSAGHAGLHNAIKNHRLGLLSARLGDKQNLLAQAEALDREAQRATGRRASVTGAFAQSLRAHAAILQGRPSEALRRLERTDWAPIESSFEEEALDRYLRATVLQELGRNTEALAWYGTIAERALHEVVYVAPTRLRQSLIAGALNDSHASANAYRVANRLWATAAPSLREQIAVAERRLRLSGGHLADSSYAKRPRR
jgi:TolB-like protein